MQHSITVNVPSSVYERIQRAAKQRRRSVDDLVAEAITAALPAMDSPADPLQTALAQLAYLNDAALWQAARATVPPALRERSEELHTRLQRGPLTDAERDEMERLEQLYRDTLLVRAQAAVLLKQRNYHVGDLSQFSPLE